MTKADMITIRNKTTGEVKTVPRSQYIVDDSSQGFSGVAQDIGNSISSLPDAASNLISSIPGGVSNVLKYATTTNPVSTLANLGAGGVESGAALLSSPQLLLRYLSSKFPQVKQFADSGKTPGLGGVNDPTIYESLMNFEKNKGLAPQSDEEASVRNAGGLLFGGKALTSLPNMATRAAALSAQQAGAGGDPIHAAILSLLGEQMARGSAKGINKAAGVQNTPDLIQTTPGSTALTANMKAAPSGSPYMQTVSNIPKAAYNIGKYISDAAPKIPEVATQALASALETGADYGSKIPMAGSVLQPTVGALASYLKHLSIPPDEMAQRKLFSDITPEDLPAMKQRLDAANRLGISFLTPSEAMLSPFQAAKEANIGRTDAGSRLLLSKGLERSGTEATAINSLLDSVYDGKNLDPQKKAAYDDAMSSTVPDDLMEKFKQDPVVENAIDLMNSKATYKRGIKDVPENSFTYWDMVKRVIGDMEKGDAKGMQKYSSDQATQARNEMVDQLDAINPRYKDARNIAEREFTRKGLEDVFDKKDMTLNNFYSLLKSDKKFDQISDKLKNFPEAQQKLQDIRLLSNNMIPFDTNIRTSYKLEKIGMTKDRNKLDALKRDLDQRFGQQHDVAAVKLMTNPNWLSILSKRLGEGDIK